MRPLLAEKVDLDRLKFPYLVSPKYDGFRCLVKPVVGALTRSMRTIPNAYVSGKLKEWGLDYFDGELLTYTGGKLDDFNTVQSKLSTRGGMPDFRYMVFDTFRGPERPFTERLYETKSRIRDLGPVTIARPGQIIDRVRYVEHVPVSDLDELVMQEERALADGWEGLMLRDFNGVYKFGRSTVRENILLKMKRTDDDEGVVVGVQERRHNANEAKTNELGYKERSSHKENMVACGDLGALTLEWRGKTFDVGTGFTALQRVQLWEQDLVGKLVSFSYQGVGSGGRPRFPRFRGLRAAEDVS